MHPSSPPSSTPLSSASLPSPDLRDARLDRLAQRRARAKLGWVVHAVVFVCVNTGLALLSLTHGRSWAIYPFLGWGLGLLMHGMGVWVFGPGSAWMQRWVARERAQLERAQHSASKGQPQGR